MDELMQLVGSTMIEQHDAVEIHGGIGNLFKVDFDFKKFITHPKLRSAIHDAGAALKDAASAPINLDDRAIDATISAIDALIDAQSQTGPLVVGDSSSGQKSFLKFKKYRTREEAEALMRENGYEPKQFAPWVILIIQLLPTAIQVLNYLRELLAK